MGWVGWGGMVRKKTRRHMNTNTTSLHIPIHIILHLNTILLLITFTEINLQHPTESTENTVPMTTLKRFRSIRDQIVK